ncbi:hypothetical protein H6P81_003248 [Aristolochia fimbriata]|uniref:DNA-directed RNA polymerase subunit n=1 Tax=Aristolochia fimbriata TaxID=158543 RepID=A0AAV7FF04_ARIFI|nr:hypothetical protein H6P81_003248 [Aristolochia fimbriata]
MEGFRVADTNLIIYIHPSKANKVKQAVFRQLSSSLFQFDEAFSGVLLAFEISFQDKTAKLLPGIAPYLSVRAKAKLLIFSPKPDMLLEGKVVKLGRESIHVIVLGFSSAVITSDDIREEFRYNLKHGEEVFASSSHKKHVIKVGAMLRFSVKSFDEDILHICGSLVPTDTGCISWLSKHSRDGLPHSNLTQEKSETGSISWLNKHSRDGALLHSNLTQEKSETGVPRNSKTITRDRMSWSWTRSGVVEEAWFWTLKGHTNQRRGELVNHNRSFCRTIQTCFDRKWHLRDEKISF